MIFKIFENGVEINRIESSLEFCEEYCASNGYTYELEPEQTQEPVFPKYTDLELAQQTITDLELTTIGQGQSMTDLELMILEGNYV